MASYEIGDKQLQKAHLPLSSPLFSLLLSESLSCTRAQACTRLCTQRSFSPPSSETAMKSDYRSILSGVIVVGRGAQILMVVQLLVGKGFYMTLYCTTTMENTFSGLAGWYKCNCCLYVAKLNLLVTPEQVRLYHQKTVSVLKLDNCVLHSFINATEEWISSSLKKVHRPTLSTQCSQELIVYIIITVTIATKQKPRKCYSNLWLNWRWSL